MSGPARRLFTVLSVPAIVIVSAAVAQELEIARSTIDAGGVINSTGGAFELSGTIGQPSAGVLSGGAFTLAGGFWFEEPPSDCNSTGTVNLFDYSDLEACLSGPGGRLVDPSCACFDLDADQNVDLIDVGEFQQSFSGS